MFPQPLKVKAEIPPDLKSSHTKSKKIINNLDSVERQLKFSSWSADCTCNTRKETKEKVHS